MLPPSAPEPAGLRTHAAVALIFGPGPDGDELLFIRRAERAGDPWSGDMAFPGGRGEPVDPSPRATAERETREEIALSLEDARFFGALPIKLSPLRIPTAGFGIFPFVYRVEAWPALALSEEVAAVHRFALGRFLEDEGRGEFRYVGYGVDRQLPCVRLDGLKIWGLSLRMVDDLIEQLRR